MEKLVRKNSVIIKEHREKHTQTLILCRSVRRTPIEIPKEAMNSCLEIRIFHNENVRASNANNSSRSCWIQRVLEKEGNIWWYFWDRYSSSAVTTWWYFYYSRLSVAVPLRCWSRYMFNYGKLFFFRYTSLSAALSYYTERILVILAATVWLI